MTPIREAIIFERTGKNLPDYLNYLVKYLKNNINKRYIVSGLGKLLEHPQKDWIRDHLYDDLMAQIQRRIEAESLSKTTPQ